MVSSGCSTVSLPLEGRNCKPPCRSGTRRQGAVAVASIKLLLESDWQHNVQRIEQQLKDGLAPCRQLECVADVRVLGAIGVVELREPVDMRSIQPRFVAHGVWVRPFGKLVYLMPPYVIDDDSLQHLTNTIHELLKHGKHR